MLGVGRNYLYFVSGVSPAAIVCALLLALIFALWPGAARAGTIAVDGTICTLPEAVGVANTDVDADGCSLVGASSGGADVLNLAEGVHELDGATLFPGVIIGNNAAPPIVSTVTIIGQGAGATVRRTGSDFYRLFYVNSERSLTLNNVTITNFDVGTGPGGAIYNSGTLKMINCSLLSNAATRGGGLSNTFGSDLEGSAEITDSYIVSNRAEYGGGINTYGTLILTRTVIFSNTASVRGGGLHIEFGNLNLTNSYVTTNTATAQGGGIATFYVGDDADVLSTSATLPQKGPASANDTEVNLIDSGVHIFDSYVTSNTALSGGGIFLQGENEVTLSNSYVMSNRAGNSGGGLFHNNGATVTLSGTYVLSNTAVEDGGGLFIIPGGFFQDSGTLNLNDSHVRANRAKNGGGLHNGNFINHDYGIITNLTNSYVVSNTATEAGGGLFNDLLSTVTLTNSYVLTNTATMTGGGLYNWGKSVLTLTGTHVDGNTANNGGGLASTGFSTATVTNSYFLTNLATQNGGALLIEQSRADISGTLVLSNRALGNGGALYRGNVGIPTEIHESCIMDNSDTAIHSEGGAALLATDNWWGAPDGPGGVGPGSGDSVSENVDFSNFRSSLLPFCAPPDDKAVIYLPRVAP